MEAVARKQREDVMRQVADMIDGGLVGKVDTAVDCKVFKEIFPGLSWKARDPDSRAKWFYESCTAWRRNNFPKISKG